MAVTKCRDGAFHSCRLLPGLGNGWSEADVFDMTSTTLKDLARRLGCNAAYDGVEKQSHAYEYSSIVSKWTKWASCQ